MSRPIKKLLPFLSLLLNGHAFSEDEVVGTWHETAYDAPLSPSLETKFFFSQRFDKINLNSNILTKINSQET
jgi:hypothetical protein